MSQATILSFPIGGRDGLMPEEPPKCSECEHANFGPHGIFCGMFREPVMFEEIAEECSEFELYPPTAA